MTANEFIALLVSMYEGNGLAEDESISIGHWIASKHQLPPLFCADIRVTLDELRKMLESSA
jgi:hypothetical protein